jgi:hypothetical protein
LLSNPRVIPFLIGAAATAAALWTYASQPSLAGARPAVVAIQDGKTIDFSNGSPAVKDGPADRAAMDKAVREMDEASKDVTFPAETQQKK